MAATRDNPRTPAPLTVQKLTPVLVVDAIEPCLSFWVDRLGFAKTVEVPEGNALGFVILVKDGIEVMYQSRESVEHDVGDVVARSARSSTGLFIEVSDIDAIARATDGLEIVVPRRRTSYGMDEIGVREPGGSLVLFAQPAQSR